MIDSKEKTSETALIPAMTRAELFELLNFYRREDQHESNLLNGRMNWYLTSQSFMVLAVCITETGPYKWLQLALPSLLSVLGMVTTVYIKMAIDAGCEVVSRWKHPQGLVWNRLSPYLIRRRFRIDGLPLTPVRTETGSASQPLERVDLVHEESMIFLNRTPALFYATWSLIGGVCLCNNPLLADRLAAKVALVAFWFAASGILGYYSLRQTSPNANFDWPKGGTLVDWNSRHTISSIVPSLGENACRELIKAAGADLPREYADLMRDCDGLIIDNCHIFGLSDVRDALRIGNDSYYQLAEIADLGGLYVKHGPPDTATVYLIRSDNAAGSLTAVPEPGGFKAIVERYLFPSLLKTSR